MPTIDIDRDAAHEAAQHELGKPIYPKASLTERLMDWIDELFYRLADAGSSVPGGWFTLSILLILLAIAIVVAVRIARRTMRTNRGSGYALFGEHVLSAAEHRATAEQYAAAGNWSAAIRHRLRAVARQLEESAVLDPVPGRTATELARDAGRAIPNLATELNRAAEAFQRRHLRRAAGHRSGVSDDRRPRRPSAVPHVDVGRNRRGARRGRRLGRSAMTPPDSAVGPTVAQRWRSARWVLLALVVIVGVATLSTYLTATRPGGPMDPESTSPEGARALVTILREHGVDVIAAGDIAAVENAARPDTLILVAQTFYLFDDLLGRLAALPGDRLLVAPVSRTREQLAPEIRIGGATTFGDSKPDCELREATRAGEVQFGLGDAYEAAGNVPVTRCYGGALIRYAHNRREVTVVSDADFMSNSGLLKQGNAALAMNLAGSHPRLIWYAPQHSEGGGESGDGAEIIETSSRTKSDGSFCSCASSSRCWRCGRVDASARWSPSSCLWWCGPRRPSRDADGCTGHGAHVTARRRRCERLRCSG